VRFAVPASIQTGRLPIPRGSFRGEPPNRPPPPPLLRSVSVGPSSRWPVRSVLHGLGVDRMHARRGGLGEDKDARGIRVVGGSLSHFVVDPRPVQSYRILPRTGGPPARPPARPYSRRSQQALGSVLTAHAPISFRSFSAAFGRSVGGGGGGWSAVATGPPSVVVDDDGGRRCERIMFSDLCRHGCHGNGN